MLTLKTIWSLTVNPYDSHETPLFAASIITGPPHAGYCESCQRQAFLLKNITVISESQNRCHSLSFNAL